MAIVPLVPRPLELPPARSPALSVDGVADADDSDEEVAEVVGSVGGVNVDVSTIICVVGSWAGSVGVCIMVDVTGATVVVGVVSDVVDSGMVVVLVGGMEVVEVVVGSVVVLVGGTVGSVVVSVVGSGTVVGSTAVGSLSVGVSDGVVTAIAQSATGTDERAGRNAARTCCVGHFLNGIVARKKDSCSSSTTTRMRERDSGKE